MNRTRNIIIAATAALILTGCTPAVDDEGPAHSPTTPPSTSATSTRAPEDVEAEFRAQFVDEAANVTDVQVPEPNRIIIQTDLEDPGRNTAPETLHARSLCEAAARVEGIEHVSVLEDDGTTWILYGHPAGPAGECFLP